MELALVKQEDLLIAYLPPGNLTAYAQNARTHSKAQIRKIADSIRSFGFTNPILIDHSGTIIAGHGRVQAAKLLGLGEVPTIRLESLTSAQIRAYVIADNRLAEDAGWDEDILRIEFQHLVLDHEIDISSTGFETAEIDLILNTAPVDAADELPQEEHYVVTKPGELWLLGEHRILCSDARFDTLLTSLMENRQNSLRRSEQP